MEDILSFEEQTCGNCYNFHKGTEQDNDYLTHLRNENNDSDKCSETVYKVTENSFCILGQFINKIKFF